MKKLRKVFLIGLLVIILLYCSRLSKTINPFSGVKWIEDYPGATDRYTTFTPVLEADTSIKLGPSTGADFGKLRFEDLNNDGRKEAIIETDPPLFDGSFFTHERHVLEYQKGSASKPIFILIESKTLDNSY